MDENRISKRSQKKLTIETECNDVFFLLIWLGVTLYTISVACTWGNEALEDNVEVLDDLTEVVTTSKARLIFNLMAAEAGVAAALSVPMLILLIFLSEFLVWGAIVTTVCLNWVVGGVLSWYIYNNDDLGNSSLYWLPAVLFGCFGAFLACWAYCVRHRIDFASGSLAVACTAVLAQPLLFVIALGSLGLQIAWICVAILGLLGADDESSTDEAQGFAILGHIFILLWGIYVFKYILHVVVSDSVGDWWDNSNAFGTTAKSLFDTCTLRLGSICFGALLVALLGTIKSLFDWLAYESKSTGNCCLYVVYCIFSAIANCLDAIMKYFNRYTFSYVGIYGYSYLNAGAEVLDLFNERGWTAIVSDALVENVLWVAATAIAILTGLIGVNISKDDEEFNDLSGSLSIAFFMGCAVGYAMATTMFDVVSAGATSVLILFAEDDDILRQYHRDEFDRLDDAWRRIYPDEYQKMVDSKKGSSNV